MKYASIIYFIPYRMKFGNSKSSAPFPSVIIVFDNVKKKDNVICKIWKYERR